MMTPQQQARIAWLRDLGYQPRVLGEAARGIVHVIVPCRLKRGAIPLHVHTDGTYMTSWHDPQTIRKAQAA